jgi:hypothetical protein
MKTEDLVFLLVIALIVVLLVCKRRWDMQQSKKRFFSKMRQSFGIPGEKEYQLERFERVSGYFEKHPQTEQIDDITWNDLNMDEVFCRIDTSLSAAGEEYLYYLLRTPSFSQEELDAREEMIRFFGAEEKNRLEMQWILRFLGHTGKFSLYDYLDYLGSMSVPSKRLSLCIDILYLPLILLTAWQVMPWLILVIVLAGVQVVQYFKEKERMQPYLISLSYLLRLIGSCDRMEQALPDIGGGLKTQMKQAVSELRPLSSKTGWLMAGGSFGGTGVGTGGNPIDLILDYIRMLTHVDLILFYRMMGYLHRHEEAVDVLLTDVGRIETSIVLASYRASLKDGYCVPVFTGEEQGLLIKEGYHPLVEEPIKNSITTKQGILLTGSNASGKSTFLKMAALEILFAQTIHTCLADQYEAPMVRLFTSMSLRDSIRQGESYFMAEIKALKRILEVREQSSYPVYCMIDEVLRGTNTVERIAASEQILRSLWGEGLLCLAATHDIELTTLLEDVYENYHFEEVIKEGDIQFPYELRKGAATTRNAILLLEIMGYPADMVAKAQERAEHFMIKGTW